MSKKLSGNKKRNEDDRSLRKFSNLCSVLTKTDRILSGNKKIVVQNVNPLQVHSSMANIPGFTVDNDIYIRSDKFDNIETTKGIIQILGINYHELSHILFSPSSTGPVRSGMMGANLVAYSILEDQRIESLFTSMYPPAGKYFTQVVSKIFGEDKNAWSSAFLLTYGRSYLPIEIREEFESRFTDSWSIPQAKKLIRQYKRFTHEDFAYRSEIVLSVIRSFAILINNSAPQQKNNCGTNSSLSATDTSDKELEKEASQRDKERQDKEDETGEDQSGFWDEEEDEEEETENDEDGSDGSDSEGESDSESGGRNDTGGTSKGDSLSSDGSDNEETDDNSSDSPGDGEDDPASGNSSATSTFDDDELEEYLEDIREAVEEDETVSEEVKRVVSAINDSSNINFLNFGNRGFKNVSVDTEMQKNSRIAAREYRKIFESVEPGWNYDSDVGKLNVGRAMLDPEDIDTIFDEWDEGREQEVGLEVFISLDTSASMRNHIDRTSKALWVIKRALDDVEAKVTVVSFDTETNGLIPRDTKVNKIQYQSFNELGGSTLPVNSIHMARRVLSASDMPNKMFIILTDGGWSNMNPETREYEDIEDAIDSVPGVKIYAGFNTGPHINGESRKHFNVAVDIKNMDDLALLVRQAVTKTLRNRLHL